MISYSRRQLNEGRRGNALGIANPGTNRLSKHPECGFCLDPPCFGEPLSILHLNVPGRAVYSRLRRPAILPDEGLMRDAV